MSLFFETLKIKNHKIYNLSEHHARLNKTVLENFGHRTSIDLNNHIKAPDEKLYRCKVTYDTEIKSVSFTPYQPKVFRHFKLINTHLSYPYKAVDRTEINKLFEQKENCDDILMIKDGLVYDTSIANIAIYDGIKWYTPSMPLLAGTQRANLLKKQIVFEKEIKVKDIKNMVSFAIMNALIGFHPIKNAKFCYKLLEFKGNR
ncbi:MAG: aminotransferase class IV [Epsilonproteobacteria bacterium]|nr:aminotransferase class IV [Campylobacterota bacterium]